MTIKHGAQFPSAKVTVSTTEGNKETTTDALFKGHRAVLFAVPGAFTPTCSERHLPGFLEHAEAFHAKGVDTLVCLSVNDPFVMKAWAKAAGVEGKITMLADGSGTLTRELGLELDLVSHGLGMRAKRFAMILDDMKVTHLAVEPPGGYGVSSAEAVLAAL